MSVRTEMNSYDPSGRAGVQNKYIYKNKIQLLYQGSDRLKTICCMNLHDFFCLKNIFHVPPKNSTSFFMIGGEYL